MAKVSLRVYNREIEGMIEAGQLDEAIAHCQFILKTYPMHVETYLLLGKAFLEARRYNDAADIFARVLMAVPDNFVSHVGMSIIRDDEGKLDDAIWHMERAFEIQPSNPAIQGELRRLYGRRDGIEPPKIRLSRDALANMYAQGELFNQAIAEIRAVLAEDNNRPDLEVMLARAYLHAGQKVEAAGMASTLLKKYAYCMDALRILVDVLPGTTRSGDTQVYLQRLSMLDPYSLFVTGSSFNSDKVADSAITLDRLEYKPSAPHIESQPDWAASLGIQLPGSKTAEPDFMSVSSSVHQPPESAVEPPSKTESQLGSTPAAAATGSTDANVPDWMRSAGWHESTGAASVEPVDSGADQPVESAAQADIPDWLKAMAPQEETHEGKEGSAPESNNHPSGGEDNLDWLTSIAQGEGAGGTKEAFEPIGENPLSVPENEINPEPTGNAAPQGITVSTVDESRPAPVEPPPAGENEGLPDWLKPMALQDAGGAARPEPESGAENLPPASRTEDLPDWLKPVAPRQAADSLQPVPGPAPEDPQASSENEGLTGWLNSLARKEAKEAAEAVAEPAAASLPPAVENEDIPDWLKSIAPQPEKAAAVAVASAAEPEPPASASESEATPAWLSGLGTASTPETAENAPSKPSIDEAALPEWLSGGEKTSEMAGTEGGEAIEAGNPPGSESPATEAVQAPAEKAVAPSHAVPVEEPVMTSIVPPAPSPLPSMRSNDSSSHPTTEPPFQPSGEVKPLYIEDDALAWLEGLAVKQGAKEEEMLTRPEERPVEMPESVSRAGGQPPGQPVAPANLGSAPAGAPAFPPGAQEGTMKETPAQVPEASSDENIDWVTRPLHETEARPEAPAPAQVEPATPDSSATIPGNDITITSWLTKLDVEEALMKARSSQPSGQPAETPGSLPDWLKDLDKPTPPATTAGAGKAESDLPEWLRQPVKPPEQEKPNAAPTGTAPEAELPSWIDEAVPASRPPAPTTPEDWLPAEAGAVPGQTQQTTPTPEPRPAVELVLEPVHEPAPGPVQPAVPPVIHLARSSGTGMLSNIPPQDKDGNLLMTAQMELDNNNLNEAMKMYLSLIKKGRLLEEVIHDLREALYRFPVDIIVWQTLGDAYMRTNQLQDALDAYTKAEELLR